MIKFLFSFFLISFFLLLPSSSQELQTPFSYLNINDGLSHNTVNCIIKDSDGMIWFGTNDGLNKYDGYEFTVYKHNPEDNHSISDNRIYSLAEDSLGNLWIGTRDGLNKYNRAKDCFSRYFVDDDVVGDGSNNFVRDLLVDEDGDVWLGTLGSGLLRLYPEKDSIEHVTSQTPDFSGTGAGTDVSFVFVDSQERFWFANNAHGLNRLNKHTGEVDYFPFENDKIELDNIGKSIYEDRSGNIWICTEGKGLFRFVEPENVFIHYEVDNSENSISNNIVKDISQDNEGRYWIATDGGGLNIYDPVERSFAYYNYDISKPNSLSSDGIYCIYSDDNDIMWIGTFGGGVNILDKNKKPFTHYTQTGKTDNELSHPSVLSFFEDKQQNVWIGTDGGGVNKFDPDRDLFTHFRHNSANPHSIGSDVVTTIFQDSNDRLWLGTYSGGLNLLHPKTGRFLPYKSDENDTTSINSDHVWSVLEDSTGVLWVGTLQGLEKFYPPKGVFQHVQLPGVNNLYSGKITNILQDSYGNMWFGGAVLISMDMETGKFTTYDNQVFSGYDIRTIFEDSHGTIWVGTEGGGLSKFDRENQTFRSYNMNDGLPSDAVHAMLEDDNGNLWISSNKGLSRFDPRQESFRNYDVHDGLQSNQFSYNAALKSSEGLMYFGGVNGFNVFFPDSIHDNTHKPPVVFTGFRLMNHDVTIGGEDSPLDKHINEIREIVLDYQESVFTFEFSALNYTAPNKNQYAYKMEGFDEEWNYVQNKRSATYTNLDAGNYVFKVKGSNNDGIWNEDPATVELEILPPWWKTTWAYGGYAIVMLLALLSFRNYLVKQQRLKNALVMKDMEREKMEELNQMKLKFYTNISHEFRTPLTLILGPLEKLMNAYSDNPEVFDHLDLMYRNTLRLSRLINQIMEFRKIETGNLKLRITETDIVAFIKEIKGYFHSHARDRGISFDFYADTDSFRMDFDHEKIDMVLYNLVSNAFKFTPDHGAISIILKTNQNNSSENNGTNGSFSDMVSVTIKDTGVGISEESLPRIFDRFYQINDPVHFKKVAVRKGTGIGLSISKEFVELHGGSIEVKSEKYKGSTFCIYLPFKQDAGEMSESDSTLTANDSLSHEDYLVEDFIEHEETVGENAEETNKEGGKPVVLVVEDNVDMLGFIHEALGSDFKVVKAKDGKIGYEEACSHIPDMIITDVMMPVMDGFELAGKVRKNEKTSHIPIIFLSAINSMDNRLQGYGFGAYDYISKPFNVSILKAKVKSVIENRRKLQEKIKRNFILSPSEVTIDSPEEVFLKKAIDVVEKHMANSEFDVKVFYSEMGLSRSVLYRKLEAITGQTVNDFVRTIRLKKAAGFLKQNKMSISEISYEVGFNDPQYFSKCFRKEFGKSPSAYAREYAEEE